MALTVKTTKAPKSDNKPRRGGKKVRPPLTPKGWPSSVLREVRAIRRDSGDLIPDRGHDRADTNTLHGTECDICGKLGEHPCLPLIHESIENCEEMSQVCWKAYKEFEKLGYWQEPEGAIGALNIEGLFS